MREIVFFYYFWQTELNKSYIKLHHTYIYLEFYIIKCILYISIFEINKRLLLLN